MRIGIPSSSIVRLGGKATPATEHLQLEKQQTNFKMTQAEGKDIVEVKKCRDKRYTQLQKTFYIYRSAEVNRPQLLEHLEFEDSEYFAAFEIPRDRNGRKVTGPNGQPTYDSYLVNRWIRGQDAGFLRNRPGILGASSIWLMSWKERQEKLKTWEDALFKDQVSQVYEIGKAFNNCLTSIDRVYGRKTEAILSKKRIIGCTTTGAAKHGERIRAASPTVVLVEEAGEILESHILTAMGPNMDQLILIGDHKSVFAFCPLVGRTLMVPQATPS